MSDSSGDEIGGGESLEELNYRRKYQMLLERCEVLQQDNERLINRIQHVYKYTRHCIKERKFLIDRLDQYNDDWRGGMSQYVLDSLCPSPKVKKSQLPSAPTIVEKPFRRPSATKKPKQKDKEPKKPRRSSKDQKPAKIKIDYESEAACSF